MPLALTTGIGKALVAVTALSLLAACGAGIYAWYRSNQAAFSVDRLQLQVQQLTTSRDAWRVSAHRWQADAKRLAEEQGAARAAVAALEEDLAVSTARYQPAQKVLDQAQPSDDGPVAPVLRNVIEALP